MTRTVKIYGPPGTGKTTRLKAIAERAVTRYGADRVAALTFTRAGAAELKTRLAEVLGLNVPADPWQAQRFLSAQLPWVGTIHSLAYKLIGRPPLVKLPEFVKSQGGHTNGVVLDADAIEGYAWAEPGRDEVEAALAIHSAARNRQIPLDAAYNVVPWGLSGPSVSLERAAYLAGEYEDFKRQTHRIDFDDMLSIAMEQGYRPPVEVILSDEVQDNSPLLWRLTDQWALAADYYATAGDPYQAIYLFSGANPDLFISHPGDLVPLGDSRRLTAPAAVRAQAILRGAGYEEGEWLGTWTGVGDGDGRGDASEFYLARTARLLDPVYDDLEDRGVPYATMRGGGPLTTKAAKAFNILLGLRRTGVAGNAQVLYLAEQCDPSFLPEGELRVRRAQAKADPDGWTGLSDLQSRWQRELTGPNLGIKKGDYYERVARLYGRRAFSVEPSIRVGTIHAAKGREADIVHLVDSWATLPYRNATDGGPGQLAEACVAYVAVTRHRRELRFIYGDSGTPYPGF